jgi:hypothetical protein
MIKYLKGLSHLTMLAQKWYDLIALWFGHTILDLQYCTVSIICFFSLSILKFLRVFKVLKRPTLEA